MSAMEQIPAFHHKYRRSTKRISCSPNGVWTSVRGGGFPCRLRYEQRELKLNVCFVGCINKTTFWITLLTRRALGGAHVPPTKVFRRLRE